MNKVLVLVYIPMLEHNYEIWIPINRKIHTVISLITKEINQLTENVFPISSNLCFYNRKTGLIYDKNLTIKETDVRNGTELVLI